MTGTDPTATYVCPANSYAIVQVAATSASTTSNDVKIGGVKLFGLPTAGVDDPSVNMVSGFYVAAGQTLTVDGVGGLSRTVSITGVEFLNTP